MTRKHFKELAAIMKVNKPYIAPETFRMISRELAEFCSRHNPNFNRAKFLEACGVE